MEALTVQFYCVDQNVCVALSAVEYKKVVLNAWSNVKTIFYLAGFN